MILLELWGLPSARWLLENPQHFLPQAEIFAAVQIK
jgi:hypothetical protein